MQKREKKKLIRILIGALLFVSSLLLQKNGWTEAWILYLIAYLILGADVIKKSLQNIAGGQVFDENFLMSVASIGALALKNYAEGVAVMLFYQVGELFQDCAVASSRRSIKALMDIRPDYAHLLRDGTLTKVDPELVEVGDRIVVQPFERVPLDGIVEEGTSCLDMAALTGESLPKETAPGSEIISGSINQTGRLTVLVTKKYAESTVAKILELVEEASDKKSKSEQFITRFARVYTPLVVAAASLLALLPPLLFGWEWVVSVERALTFLVVSCPCALVISVPLSFFGGIGGAAAAGILIKGSNYLEILAKTDTMVFDKTGTLTKGNFEVSGIYPEKLSETQLLDLAAHAEESANHPVAKSLKNAYGKPLDRTRIGSVEEHPGFGVKAIIDGIEVLAGNSRLLEAAGISCNESTDTATIVHLAANGVYAGSITVSDNLKPGTAAAINQLKSAGIKETILLTGDKDAVGKAVAKELHIHKVHTELLPGGKVEKLTELLQQKGRRGYIAFVGDGINDAPALARADVGIAMGALGSDAAMESADIVLMTDELSSIAAAIKISRKTLQIAKQNITFALTIKAVVLLLSALGITSMWMAVFADVGVSVIAICNALRALRTPKA